MIRLYANIGPIERRKRTGQYLRDAHPENAKTLFEKRVFILHLIHSASNINNNN